MDSTAFECSLSSNHFKTFDTKPTRKRKLFFSLLEQKGSKSEADSDSRKQDIHDSLNISDTGMDSTSSIPVKFKSLIDQTIRATIPKGQDNTQNAHDPFRFEWGTWADNDAILSLMQTIDFIRAAPGSMDVLLSSLSSSSSAAASSKYNKVNIAKGTQWEINLYAFSSNSQYEGNHPTGSWTILKALTGVVEIAMLREDRDGNYKKSSKRDLRGGIDPSYQLGTRTSTPITTDSVFSSSTSNPSLAIGGEECIKYVGGPIRSYMGKSQRNILLEVTIRPPGNEMNADRMEPWTVVSIPYMEDLMDVYIPPPPTTAATTTTDSNATEKMTAPESVMAQEQATKLSTKLGMDLDKVGGLDTQLDTIVRRVLASRANPQTAKRLGISHVRGILLSGPPGCGKTLLARELARLLGAREPQIVNGPEILDKFIGEAEKRVRDLFRPAEMEYAAVGDDSALHVIILDEMDAIARKRGSSTSDTTGVRDSVVNQLLAKMDGVKEANNILVIGLTNRPELLDPALLRPGRLEVQLRIELPDLKGRRDIYRIHTRQMKDADGLEQCAQDMIEDLSENGLASQSEKFTGAEIAGLVRSAASFALARSVSEAPSSEISDIKLTRADFERALLEVTPVLGRQEELLKIRFPYGISICSPSMERIVRDLQRFVAPTPLAESSPSSSSRLHSLLLVGAGSKGDTGVTALSAWTASMASQNDALDYVHFITSIDLLNSGNGSGSEGARASALVDCFLEAKVMPNSMLVLDDIDQICAGNGPGGYSTVMISTLRALIRTPPDTSSVSKAGGQSISKRKNTIRSMHVLATTSRSDAACSVLHEIFEEVIVVPLLSDVGSVDRLLMDLGYVHNSKAMASLMMEKLTRVGVKSVIRLAERAQASASLLLGTSNVDKVTPDLQTKALKDILNDLESDAFVSNEMCELMV